MPHLRKIIAAFALLSLFACGSAYAHAYTVGVSPGTVMANSNTIFTFTIRSDWLMRRVEVNRSSSGFAISGGAACPYGWRVNASDSARVICEANSSPYFLYTANVSFLAAAPNSSGIRYWRTNVTWNDFYNQNNVVPVMVTVIPQVDYAISQVRTFGLMHNMNQAFAIEVRTRNIGPHNATRTSVTRLGGNCAQLDRQVPALNAGEEYVDSGFSCTCSHSGLNTLLVTANAQQSVNESNYANNYATAIFYCSNPYVPLCFDYV